MRFHQNFNKLAIRPYGRGYQAPSTALFNTDLGKIQIAPSGEHIDFIETVQMPDFIEVLIDFISIPLPHDNIMATYQFDNVIWPSVPLYPSEEPQFISALKLVFGGVIKIRDSAQKESVLIRGMAIEGFELDVKEAEPVYVHKFDYHRSSIDYSVREKRVVVPIWPAGGFYRPGCELEQIQQVFCSLSEFDQKTFTRKTLLTQWNDQGFYPPYTTEKDEQKTVFQVDRQDLYVRFIDEIRKGVATIHLIDRKADGSSACFTYKSVDIKPYGIGKAFVHFMRV